MRITCIGGGPAGLYFALLMKLQDARHEVTVIERNAPTDTFGWGVVFSDQTLGALQRADAKTAGQILDAFNHWDDIDVHFKGRTLRSTGHGFCGIGRMRLLNILQARCAELGVDIRYKTECPDDADSDDDGVLAEGIGHAEGTPGHAEPGAGDRVGRGAEDHPAECPALALENLRAEVGDGAPAIEGGDGVAVERGHGSSPLDKAMG